MRVYYGKCLITCILNCFVKFRNTNDSVCKLIRAGKNMPEPLEIGFYYFAKRNKTKRNQATL